MKKYLIVSLLLITLLYIFPSRRIIAQSQLYPLPGANCGVPFDDKKGVYDSNNLSHKIYNCCSSILSGLKIDANPGDLSFLPGGIGSGIFNFLNDNIDAFPFNFIPQPFRNNLPSIGLLKKAFGKVNPCYQTAGPVGTIGESTCYCKLGVSQSLYQLIGLCDGINNTKEIEACKKCLKSGLWTGLGCLKTSFTDFIQETLLGFAVSLAGMVAFICIIFSAFNIQLSKGNPEKVKKAQEILTSCIVGLILIIFSVFILRLIGVNILKIPGFG